MSSTRPIFRRLPWLDWPAVIVIAIVGILSYKYEDFKEEFPRLITLQLWAYQGITNAFLPKPQAKWVVPVKIDDTTFYEFLKNESHNDVTDRKYLAELIKATVAARPAVIALDINFDATTLDKSADKQKLNEDDQALFNAILEAQRANIPVILTYGFRDDMVPVAQIFDGEAVLPENGATEGITFRFPNEENVKRPFWVPRYGFDHPADDLRKVPLVAVGPDKEGKGAYDYYSFALQIADAYSHWASERPHETVIASLPKEHGWVEELTKYEFVYTTFIPVSGFVVPELRPFTSKNQDVLSAVEVFCEPLPGKDWNDEICKPSQSDRRHAVPDVLRDKIVLIGGDRHGYKGEEGESDLIDNHQSPVGPLRGMYFQANYVEGLLDNRVLYGVPPLIAALIDIVLAMVVLWVASLKRGYWERTGIIAAMLVVPALLAGIAALAFHRCLDFVFPLVLLILHPALDSYIHLVPWWREKEVALD